MKEEKITLFDRIAIASLIFFLSFITATICWLFIVIVFEPWNINTVSFDTVIDSFDTVLYFSGFVTFFGFITPNKALSILGGIWDIMHKVIVNKTNDINNR